MGFMLDNTYRLVFEEFKDDEGNCLEVQVKPINVNDWLKVREGDFASDGELFDLFADHLVGWNLENRDQDGRVVAVPATREGVRSQDARFVDHLFALWVGRIGKVDDPLPQPSGDGRPSLEESIPMEPLSPSLAS